MKKFALLLLIVTFLIGCAQSQVTKKDGVQEDYQAGETGDTKSKDQGYVGKYGEESVEGEDMSGSKSGDSSDGNVLKDIYFDYDRYDIKEISKITLRKVSNWLIQNSDSKILVEGHCDERGTNEYNVALGDQRAQAVRDYLGSLGVAGDRIEAISYGEEKPQCYEQDESCWSRNRRAHFIEYGQGG